MYRPTTALTKIAELQKRIRVIQGGQGAGKTIAILLLLINYAQHETGASISIIQAELSKLKKTAMRDFISIMVKNGFWEQHRWNKSESIYTFPKGGYIEFIGLDRADVGKGFRRDVVYFNEVNKGGITLDGFMQFATRAEMVFCDFNPDKRFWLHREVVGHKNTDFIILTHEDNEYLPDFERDEILDYKVRGFFDYEADDLFHQDNVKSKYWANKHKVYGLGVPGSLEGLIFDNYSIIDRVPPLAKYIGSGMDFGFTNDPSVVMDCYLYNGRRIWDEALYKTGYYVSDIYNALKQDKLLRTIYADRSAPMLIAELRRHGLSIVAADGKGGKSAINYGIELMQMDNFYVTKRSHNTLNELESYTWQVNRDGDTINAPVETNNHSIDSMRNLAVMKFKKNSGQYAVR